MAHFLWKSGKTSTLKKKILRKTQNVPKKVDIALFVPLWTPAKVARTVIRHAKRSSGIFFLFGALQEMKSEHFSRKSFQNCFKRFLCGARKSSAEEGLASEKTLLWGTPKMFIILWICAPAVVATFTKVCRRAAPIWIAFKSFGLCASNGRPNFPIRQFGNFLIRF